MSRGERILRQLRPQWPETPDLWPDIEANLTGPPPRSYRLVAMAAALLVVLAVGAGLTRALPVVAEGLGIGSVEIELGPIDTVATELRLGNRRTADGVAFAPAALGSPDAVYVDRSVTWLVYGPRADLPEVLGTGVGALVARIEGDGLLEKVIDPTVTDRIDVTVQGHPAVWLEGGEHELLVERADGRVVSSRGRLAGNTLLWEEGGITYRLELALPLAEALRIAESVEP